MQYYYVIEENISCYKEHSGKRYIIYKGCVFAYGDFRIENGFQNIEDARKEIQKAEEQNLRSLSLSHSTVNLCEYYIEIHRTGD